MEEVRLGARELAARARQAWEKQRRREAEQRSLVTFERRARLRRSLNRLTAASEALAGGHLAEAQVAVTEVRGLRTLSPDLQTILDHVVESVQTETAERAAAQLRTVCEALRQELAPRTVQPAVAVSHHPVRIDALRPAKRSAESQDVHTRIPLSAWLAALHPPKRRMRGPQMRGPHVAAAAALTAVMLGSLAAWQTVRPASTSFAFHSSQPAVRTTVQTAAVVPSRQAAPAPSAIQVRTSTEVVVPAIATTGTSPAAATPPVPSPRSSAALPGATAITKENVAAMRAEPLSTPRAVTVEEVPMGTPLPAPPPVSGPPAPAVRPEAVEPRVETGVAPASIAGERDDIDRTRRSAARSRTSSRGAGLSS